jgi:hypothetical protein
VSCSGTVVIGVAAVVLVGSPKLVAGQDDIEVWQVEGALTQVRLGERASRPP